MKKNCYLKSNFSPPAAGANLCEQTLVVVAHTFGVVPRVVGIPAHGHLAASPAQRHHRGRFDILLEVGRYLARPVGNRRAAAVVVVAHVRVVGGRHVAVVLTASGGRGRCVGMAAGSAPVWQVGRVVAAAVRRRRRVHAVPHGGRRVLAG